MFHEFIIIVIPQVQLYQSVNPRFFPVNHWCHRPLPSHHHIGFQGLQQPVIPRRLLPRIRQICTLERQKPRSEWLVNGYGEWLRLMTKCEWVWLMLGELVGKW